MKWLWILGVQGLSTSCENAYPFKHGIVLSIPLFQSFYYGVKKAMKQVLTGEQVNQFGPGQKCWKAIGLGAALLGVSV